MKTAKKKEAGFIDCEPNWPGVVRWFHANDDLRWWRKNLAIDDNGWFAAVARTHPDPKVKALGMKSGKFDPARSYSGVSKEVKS